MRACPHPLPGVVAKGIHSEEDQKTIRWIVFPTNDGLLEAASDLPAAARPAVDILAAQLRETREKIEVVTTELAAAQKDDPLARRLAAIPGIGAITASAIAESRQRRAFRTTHDRHRTADRQSPNVALAHPRHASRTRLAAGRMLTRDKTEPGRDVSAGAEHAGSRARLSMATAVIGPTPGMVRKRAGSALSRARARVPARRARGEPTVPG